MCGVGGSMSRRPMLRPQHGPSVQPRQTTRSVKPLRSFSKLKEEQQWILHNNVTYLSNRQSIERCSLLTLGYTGGIAAYSPVNISPPPALPGRVFAVVSNCTYRPLSHTCSLTSTEKSSLCSVLLSRRPCSRSMDNDYRNDFSDISDSELLEASQVVEQLEYSYFLDAELIAASQYVENSVNVSADDEHTIRPFLKPMSGAELKNLTDSRFPKKTLDQATWAVTLFGEWRAR